MTVQRCLLSMLMRPAMSERGPCLKRSSTFLLGRGRRFPGAPGSGFLGFQRHCVLLPCPFLRKLKLTPEPGVAGTKQMPFPLLLRGWVRRRLVLAVGFFVWFIFWSATGCENGGGKRSNSASCRSR